MIILRALEGEANITVDSLCETSFWVQMYNLPISKRTTEVVRLISARVSIVQAMEDESFWNRCIRFMVKIRVDKPLQCGLFVTDGESQKAGSIFGMRSLQNFAICVALVDILRRIVMGGMGSRR